ncbi:hypothetical protein C8J27_10384 [Rhodobacter aestuarii]|uniref:Uncharacterized protein n=1 Tax=Rhodobacter aestuarii TaxID=453582 RepID=A0A1N7KCR9_9RHOB|nr:MULTISPECIES: hypothetical protein [Rhodobacter]PTV95756.1 hypothetical protein C8J27_10384 [Rhodobacter aestuarii]SIS59407.1 hypothetical protein SAMN05421580_102350 [Rhodobacter aestuarii]SOC17469.1 hypothetical protein SAMN05877809_10994 [Rhodobacter sp. JA431]
MIRPELRDHLTHHRETYIAGLCVAGSAWVGTRGGWFLAAIGLALGVVCAVWMLLAWRRTRFARPVSEPGLVDLDEGRIGYYGAGGAVLGGYIALEDLAEIRLLSLRGQKFWRLKAADGQALLVPVAASGSEKLYDAFATLPGIEMGALTAALSSSATAQSLWRRRV